MTSDKINKTLFFIFGLAIVFSLSAFLVKKNLDNPKITGPAIMFKEGHKDLGTVTEGAKVEGFFEFINAGQSNLIITNVAVSCGCTGVVMDSKNEYQPGETGKIKFTFNTEGRVGINQKSITVHTNDPNKPSIGLTFSCNIHKKDN